MPHESWLQCLFDLIKAPHHAASPAGQGSGIVTPGTAEARRRWEMATPSHVHCVFPPRVRHLLCGCLDCLLAMVSQAPQQHCVATALSASRLQIPRDSFKCRLGQFAGMHTAGADNVTRRTLQGVHAGMGAVQQLRRTQSLSG